MNEIIDLSKSRQNCSPEFIDKVNAAEKKISTMPGAMFGDCFPLKHSFADGAYIREIFVPAGMLVVTKIHKVAHPYFIMKGDVSILTEEGVTRKQAPFTGITPSGTKRICFCHTDTWWITVHVTKETDLEKIEEEVIAKTFDEIAALPNYVNDFLEGEQLCLGRL